MSVVEQHCGQPGLVVAVVAAAGDVVEPGDVLVVVESMKCEHRVVATAAGRVDWVVTIGTVVAATDPIVRLTCRSTPRPPAPADVVRLYLDGALHLTGGRCGSFQALDLDLRVGDGQPDRLVPTTPRPDDAELDPSADAGAADPSCGVTVGIMSHHVGAHAEPVRRVWLCGDATRSLGAVAEPECRRILAAIDLAEAEQLPLEWVTVSSGARISMGSGTENMDWCAAVVRRLVEFTQDGGEVVIVVAGVNVGAQSYWNAEATMLMHCAGTLVMVDGTSMVLTGSRSLARAGGVSERSDHDLGGTGVMAPNGQAHHVVPDLRAAVDLVLEHHALCATGPRHPLVRSATTDDPDRDVGESPYDGPDEHGWRRVGEILCPTSHPSRTRPFHVAPVMAAVADCDAPRLERWADMDGAGGAVVWDTRIDGWPVSLVGIESAPRGAGDDWEAAGTLYPMAARKVARALNRASGRRPAVVLANLAGFDGSRSSLEGLQLEHGAELARAVVNFRGPLVVVVIGRFHGGAYVVLNRRLNPELRIVALEGTRVSVIGGSSAAEVVLGREVTAEMERTGRDRDGAVRAVADRFDEVHGVHRALEVGSVDLVVSPSEVRGVVGRLVAPPSPAISPRRPAPPRAGRTAVLS
jgi:acetyl-CoA carboxylase carboxyltransferase component